MKTAMKEPTPTLQDLQGQSLELSARLHQADEKLRALRAVLQAPDTESGAKLRAEIDLSSAEREQREDYIAWSQVQKTIDAELRPHRSALARAREAAYTGHVQEYLRILAQVAVEAEALKDYREETERLTGQHLPVIGGQFLGPNSQFLTTQEWVRKNLLAEGD